MALPDEICCLVPGTGKSLDMMLPDIWICMVHETGLPCLALLSSSSSSFFVPAKHRRTLSDSGIVTAYT